MWFSKPAPSPEPEAPFFVWSSEEHTVGVAVFDKDHERLAILMSRINTTLQEKHDRALALKLMESLIYETQAHFDHEEWVMEQVAYPEREAHAAEHSALIQEVKILFQKFRIGGISALAIPNFIKAWLIPHMKGTDRKYAACLRRSGLR